MLENIVFVGEIEAARFCTIIVLEIDLRQISVRFGLQNPTKICPKRAPKAIQNKLEKNVMCGIAHWPSFGRFEFPTWGAKGSHRELFSGSSPILGPL